MWSSWNNVVIYQKSEVAVFPVGILLGDNSPVAFSGTLRLVCLSRFLFCSLILTLSLPPRCMKSSDALPAHGPAKPWVSNPVSHNQLRHSVGGTLRKARPDIRVSVGSVLVEQVLERNPYALLDRSAQQTDTATSYREIEASSQKGLGWASYI